MILFQISLSGWLKGQSHSWSLYSCLYKTIYCFLSCLFHLWHPRVSWPMKIATVIGSHLPKKQRLKSVTLMKLMKSRKVKIQKKIEVINIKYSVRFDLSRYIQRPVHLGVILRTLLQTEIQPISCHFRNYFENMIHWFSKYVYKRWLVRNLLFVKILKKYDFLFDSTTDFAHRHQLVQLIVFLFVSVCINCEI